MLNAQPDMVCGRYGDGGECDKWITREQAAEASASTVDFPRKTMEKKKKQNGKEISKTEEQIV